MANQISGKQYAVKDLLSEHFLFNIPGYQRPYAWEVSNAEELFMDLLYCWKDPNQAEDPYFLGSIVLIKTEGQPKSDVVDGQQRLTTLISLLAVLTSYIQPGASRVDFQNYILQPERESQNMPQQARLVMRSADHPFFEKYILGLKIKEMLEGVHPTSTESQKRLMANCRRFVQLIEEHLKNEEKSIKQFASFIIGRCCLVAVQASSRQMAFRVFSVLNSRGLDLLPVDIIKARVIGMLEAANVPADEIEDYTSEWESLEERCGRKGFDELIGHVRAIYLHQRTRTTIREDFETSILDKTTDICSFLDEEFFKYVKGFLVIRNRKWVSEADAGVINAYLGWLNRVETDDWMPLAIRFFFTHGKSKDTEYVKWFFQRLEALAAYFHIASVSAHKRQERYFKILEAMKQNHDAANPLTELELTAEEKTDFNEHLDGDVYLKPSRRRNYLVLRLDSLLSDGGAVYNDKLQTIEHVFPQTVKDDSDWAKTWTNPLERKLWLHKIGNLVPLVRRTNSRASNRPFEDKKKTYFDGKSGVSSFALTSQVISESEWTPQVVKVRQQKLLDVLGKQWALN